MKLFFRQLSVRNFLSYGNAETIFNLDEFKTTLITAKNGAGKSSLVLDTLCYALFNKPYRDIKLGQLINSINNKNCVVQCWFEIGNDKYRVVRGQKPSVFEIWKNDELIPQEAATSDYQRLLETIIGFNYTTFKQIVVIGSANYVPFMELDAKNRRAVVEEILDIGVFSSMSEVAKKKLNELKLIINNLDHEIMLFKDQIASNERTLASFSVDVEEINRARQKKMAEQESRLTSLKQEENELIDKLSTVSTEASDTSELDDAARKLDTLIAQRQQVINSSNDTLGFFDSHDSCPKCHQTISQDLKNETIQREHSVINSTMVKIAQLTEMKKDVSLKLSERKLVQQKIAALNTELRIKRSEISTVESSIKSLAMEKGTSNLDVSIKELEKSIEESKDKLQKKTDEKVSAMDDAQYYMMAVTMLKDTGIKSRIIAQFIPLMNQYINEYMTKFDMFVNFELDENFDETIKSRNRDTFSYNSFSEGEKMRINLSILFAWRRIAMSKNSISTNIIVFDETLDSSLDEEAVDTFVNILGSIEEDTNVIVISHRKVIDEMFDRVVVIKKVNDFSVVIT